MQIKVKDTRMHEVRLMEQQNSYVPHQVPVAEAKLVLVECEEIKHAILHNIINKNSKFYKPILISETEKIEVGDYYLHSHSKSIEIETPETAHGMCDCKKILALPEHFSQSTLQSIVDGQLKDGDKVLVECDERKLEGIRGDISKIIKLNSSNHITLYKVEVKMYPLQAIMDAFEAGVTLGLCSLPDKSPGNPPSYDTFKKWFEQNVK